MELGDLLDRQRDARLVEEEDASVVVSARAIITRRCSTAVRPVIGRAGSMPASSSSSTVPTRALSSFREKSGPQPARIPRPDSDVLRDGQLREVAQLLVDEREPELVRQMRPIAGGRWPSREQQLAGIRLLGARDHVDQAALAGAVLPDEPDDFTRRRHAKFDAGQRHDARKEFDDASKLDERRVVRGARHA